VWWDEIARVLMPGGTYFAQHVGVIYLRTLIESFVGAQPRKPRSPIRGQLNPDTVSAEVAAAGLDVVDPSTRTDTARVLRCRRSDLLPA